MSARISATRKRSAADLQTRLAYHEAGHGVLGLALHDAPRRLSMLPNGEMLGHTALPRSPRSPSPLVLVQIYLAGFAAEHLYTRRRPRQLDQEVRFALLARADPGLAAAFPGFDACDGFRAVREVLRMLVPRSDQELWSEIYRFYEAARESLMAAWPAVQRLAMSLLEREELDRDGVLHALRDVDVSGPILAVQHMRGLHVGPSAKRDKRGKRD